MTWIRAGIAILIIGFVVVSGLEFHRRSPGAVEPSPTAAPAPVVTEKDNGIVYIRATGDEYLKALEAFYTDNGNQYLHCDYQGAVETLSKVEGFSAAHVVTTGHILRCHDIAIPAQDVTVP